jgi:phosphohistidine phosphatase SixA
MKGVNFETIYVSPFIRTLQTANEIGSILDLTLTPTLGIGSCAAFVKHFGLDYILKSNYFIDKESRERLCNQCKVLDFRTEKLNFRENLERILIDMINEKNVNDNILVVTHREGIYDIVQDRKGCNVPWTIGTPEYCGCFVLQFKYIDDGKSTPYKKWRLKTKDFALTLIAIKPKMISKMKISRRKKLNCSSVPTAKLPSSAEKHARNRLGKKDTKNGVLASIIPRNFIIYTKIRNTEYQKMVRASQLL